MNNAEPIPLPRTILRKHPVSSGTQSGRKTLSGSSPSPFTLNSDVQTFTSIDNPITGDDGILLWGAPAPAPFCPGKDKLQFCSQKPLPEPPLSSVGQLLELGRADVMVSDILHLVSQESLQGIYTLALTWSLISHWKNEKKCPCSNAFL